MNYDREALNQADIRIFVLDLSSQESIQVSIEGQIDVNRFKFRYVI